MNVLPTSWRDIFHLNLSYLSTWEWSCMLAWCKCLYVTVFISHILADLHPPHCKVACWKFLGPLVSSMCLRGGLCTHCVISQHVLETRRHLVVAQLTSTVNVKERTIRQSSEAELVVQKNLSIHSVILDFPYCSAGWGNYSVMLTLTTVASIHIPPSQKHIL